MGLGLFVLWLSAPAITAPWDVFTLLDGGYRLTEGQVPSTDFSNPIGPLVYGLIALGMHLQAVPSLAALSYAVLLFLPLAAGLAWFVSRSRLPLAYASGFTVFISIVVVSMRPLGYPVRVLTYAMMYNSFGWVLYSTLLLLVLLSPRVRPRPPALDGLVLGLLLGLLLYDKVSFFLAGLVAVGVGLALSTLAPSAKLLLSAVGGLLAVVVAMQVAVGISLTAYISDILDAARVQDSGQRTRLIAHLLVENTPVIVVTVVVLGALYLHTRRRGEPVAPVLRLSVAVGYTVGSSILISAGDAPEHSDLPALIVAALLVVAQLRPRLPAWAAPGERPGGQPALPAVVLVALAVLLVATSGPIVAKDALAMGKAASLRSYVAAPPEAQLLDAQPLHDFVIPEDADWQTAYRTAHDVPAMINDGLTLLRRHVEPGQTIFTVALTDPFSFPLGQPSPEGGPLWWDLGYDFDQSSHPAADDVLGTADWVMIPHMVPAAGCCQETVQVMLSLYGDYLDAHFHSVESTTDWTLLARTS